MVAGGLVQRDETGHAEVRTGSDPLHAQKVVGFAKVRATGCVWWQLMASVLRCTVVVGLARHGAGCKHFHGNTHGAASAAQQDEPGGTLRD